MSAFPSTQGTTPRRAILAAFLFAAAPAICKAEVFYCKDSAGRTIFKDSECGKNEEFVTILDHIPHKETIIPPHSLGENLVKNGSFEDNLNHWKIPLGVAWAPYGGLDHSGALLFQTKPPAEGQYRGRTEVEQCIPLIPAEEYEFSASLRVKGKPKQARANHMELLWYESEDCTETGQVATGLYAEDTATWQHFETITVRPMLNARSAKILIRQDNQSSNRSKAYWDDFRLHPSQISQNDYELSKDTTDTAKPGDNVVINGDFEIDLFSWKTGNWNIEWTKLEGHKSPGSAKATVRIKPYNNDSTILSQCIRLATGNKFNLTASFKISNESTQLGESSLNLTWYEKTNCEGRSKRENSVFSDKKMNWQILQMDALTRPENTKSALISARQFIHSEGHFVAFWDDINLIITE